MREEERKKIYDLIDKMVADWPSEFVPRKEVKKFTGGLISPRTMANLDCKGLGPPGRCKIGGNVVYPKYELGEWLKGRVRVIGRAITSYREIPVAGRSGKCPKNL